MKNFPLMPPEQLNFFSSNLIDQLNPEHDLITVAKKIPWNYLEKEFSKFYHRSMGRPAKPIRLMTGLLILKQLENLSNERIVEAWVRDPYMQRFCGVNQFQWQLPCDPSDLSYFRKRIGEEGVQKILEALTAIHGKKALEAEVTTDTP
jgi:IS5 family transposase